MVFRLNSMCARSQSCCGAGHWKHCPGDRCYDGVVRALARLGSSCSVESEPLLDHHQILYCIWLRRISRSCIMGSLVLVFFGYVVRACKQLAVCKLSKRTKQTCPVQWQSSAYPAQPVCIVYVYVYL